METKLPKTAISKVFCWSWNSQRYFHPFPKHAGKIISAIYMSKNLRQLRDVCSCYQVEHMYGTHVSAVVVLAPAMVHFEVNYFLILL